MRTQVGNRGIVGHVSASGEPQRAVVLVHGVGSSARAFGRLGERLVQHGEVHAVDLPGFGSSPHPGRDVPVQVHAGVLARYVREHILDAGLPPPVLVAHSMGTQVVGQLLADVTGIASAAVLVGPTADPPARTIPRQATRLALDAVGEPPRAIAVLLVDFLFRCRLSYYLAQLRHVVEHRLEDVLPHADAPVVVVRGHRDPVAPAPWVALLAARAPRGRAATVRGRHHAMDSDPDGLAAVVLEVWPAAEREVR